MVDDCARLRDVMTDLQNLPEVRFKPALLVIQWSDGDEANGVHDFTRMVEQFREASLVESTYTFSISPQDKDLDERLQKLLKIVKLDVDDSLMHVLSWQGMYEHKYLCTHARNPHVGFFFFLYSQSFRSCSRSSSNNMFQIGLTVAGRAITVSDIALWLCTLDLTANPPVVDWPRYNDVAQSIEHAQTWLAKALLSILSLPQRVPHIDRPDDLKRPAQLGHG